jgi:PHS family inorganic phosphate transporter-like MFS transporter
MQGFGILVGSIVSLIILAIFKNAIYADQINLDYVWRLCLGFGAIPGVVAIYHRLTIPESPRYTLDVDQDIEKALKNAKKMQNTKVHIEKFEPLKITKDEPKESQKASFREFCRHFSKWRNFKLLLATSMTWFVLDVAFYGVNLNASIIIEAIGFSEDISGDVWNSLFKNALGNIIIALLGTVPGYWVSVFLIDKIGRKTIQIIGFAALTILFIVLGFAYHQIKSFSIILFIALFSLMQFFNNFGPNVTTFIIPGEVFPTKYRSTAHGISAAWGKLGAIVSQGLFNFCFFFENWNLNCLISISVGLFQIKDIGGKNAKIPLILQIFSVFMFIGLLFTLLLPETKGKSLEEIVEHNENNAKSRKIKKNSQSF